MVARGRKSAATSGVILAFGEPPKPPEELTSKQAEEWCAIVRRLPVAFFAREIHPLLAQYCRHIVNARHIAELIEAAHKGDLTDRVALGRFSRLLALQERQTCALTGLATKMRLTQQARYTPKAAATATRGGYLLKPWES